MGTICLSVRLLSTLGTGDLLCVLVAVEVNGTRVVDLGPYPSGGTLGALSYASTEEQCIRAVFSVFLEYLPYIMLLQTLILVVVEKFTFRVPRVAQRVERFYKVNSFCFLWYIFRLCIFLLVEHCGRIAVWQGS